MSAILFVLTFYTYAIANIFTPLLLASLYLIYRPAIKEILKPLILGTLLLLPIAYHLTLGQAAGRFSLISIFSDSNLTDQVIISRTQPWADSNLDRFFINKATVIPGEFFTNYLSSFSPQFLFTSGDPYYRHSINNFGQLLWVFLPFLILGFIKVGSTLKDKSNRLILAWLFLSPIPAALTQSGGMHATRLFIMLPPLIWLTATGLHISLTWVKNNYSKFFMPYPLFLIALTAINLAAYWYQFSAHYRYESANFYDYGYQQIFESLKDNQDNYQKIYINNTNQPALIRFTFYAGYPPAKFQKNFTTDIPQQDLTDLFSGFKLEEKYYFGKIKDPDKIGEILTKDSLYLAVQGQEVPGDWDWSVSPPQGVKSIAGVKDIYNQPLFYLLTSP